MTADAWLPGSLADDLCASFAVRDDGPDRWVVRTPLLYEDGDGLPVVIVRTTTGWQLTDDGAAVAHLFFDDFDYTDARLRRLTSLALAGGADFNDERRITVDLDGPPTPFDIGDFLQLIAQVQGLARSTADDPDQTRYRAVVRNQIISRLSMPSYEKNWTPDALGTARARYAADLRIDAAEHAPIAVFAASTDDKVNVAALSVHQFRRAHATFQPVLAYYPGRVHSRALARFQDEVEDDRAIVATPPGDLSLLVPHLKRMGAPV